MTNGEKYKTAKTRERAFKEFCNKNNCFDGNCPVIQKILSFKKKSARCSFVWLDLETKKKKGKQNNAKQG